MGSPFAEAFERTILGGLRFWIPAVLVVFVCAVSGYRSDRHDPLTFPAIAALYAVGFVGCWAFFFYVLDVIVTVLSSCPSPAPC